MEARLSVAATAAPRSASATTGGLFAGVHMAGELGFSGMGFPLHAILGQIAPFIRRHRLCGLAGERDSCDKRYAKLSK